MSDLRRSLLLLLFGLFGLATAMSALGIAMAFVHLVRQHEVGTGPPQVARIFFLGLLPLLPISAACAVWGYAVLVRRLVLPAEKLLQRIEAAGMSDAADWLPEESAGGYSRLSHALSALLSSLVQERNRLRETVAALEAANLRIERTQTEMVRAERLAGVGRLASGLAHEIGNPLGIATGYLQLARDEETAPAERGDFLTRASRELERIDNLIRRLLLCSRDGVVPGARQRFALNSLLHGLCNDLRDLPLFRQIDLVCTAEATPDELWGDPSLMRQVALNCLLNAADALADMPQGKSRRIDVSTACLDGNAEQPRQLEVRIVDNGCGISPEHLPLVFDPFFTSKEPGRGTGLGLSVCHALVEEMGGAISLTSVPGDGAVVRIAFPLPQVQES